MRPTALIIWSIFFAIFFGNSAFAQSAYGHPAHHALADSIRLAYALPCVGYAVIGTDGTMDLEVIGVKKLGTDRPATIHDPFRIGSNTKAVTACLATILVEAGQLDWDTGLFDLFPSWKAHAKKAYYELTLEQLLSFRAPLPKWTYSFAKPDPRQIQGNAAEQRSAFGKWILRQKPVHTKSNFQPSNLSYVLAGLMLEKAYGGDYAEMVDRLLNKRVFGFEFGIGTPAAHDSLGIWGHDGNLQPESPTESVRLNWLMAAGNLHISLLDYAKFLQMLLRGARTGNALISKQECLHMLFGHPEFALGWFWGTDPQGRRYAHNLGNPGTFLCRTLVMPDADRAYIVFSNCMTDRGHEGTALLMARLSGVGEE